MKLLLLALIGVIAFASTNDVFAQEVYRGDTYQDIDYGNSTHKWIGGLEPYTETGNYDNQGRKIYTHHIIDDQPTYVKIETGSASFVFDKTTCSAKLYKGGIINDSNDFIIASDSFVPLSSVDGSGVWNVVNSVNNASCVTEIIETENSIEISGTKTSSAGIFKVRYVKEDGKPLESFLEATNLTSLTDRRFGVTQTMQIPQIIKWGNSQVDLANFVGQTKDRTWLENNKANLIHLTENFKFDTLKAWNNLESVKINSVSNGLASISFNYIRNTPILLPNETLIIDPTYSSAPSTKGRTGSDNPSSGSCIGRTKNFNDATLNANYGNSGFCTPVYAKYDVTSIPDLISVYSATFTYDVSSTNLPANCSLRYLTHDPAGANQTTYNESLSNTVITTADNGCRSTGTGKTQSINTVGQTLIANTLSTGQNWIAHSFYIDTPTTPGASQSALFANLNLEIVYETNCSAPTFNTLLTQNTTSMSLSWSPPSPICRPTNYKVFESVSGGPYTLKETLGNVTSKTYNALSTGTKYSFKLLADNSAGGGLSNSTVKTNSTLPIAPTSLVATPVSKTQINVDYSDGSQPDILWFKSRYSSGGAWTNMHTNSSVNTPRYENFTGLTTGTQYNMQIASGTLGGFGAWSSNVTARTYTTTSGTITFPALNIGDVLNGTTTVTITAASPSPVTVSKVDILQNGTTVQSNTVSQSIADGGSYTFTGLYYLISDDNPYSYRSKITVSNGTGTIDITSNAVNYTREYDPDYFQAVDPTQGFVNYTIARTVDQNIINLKINRQENGTVFPVECQYRTMTQAALNAPGTWHNYTNVGYLNDTLDNAAGTHYYIDCYNDGLLFNVISYTNSSMLLAGIEVFDNTYGTFIGVPVGVFFVVLVAGMANQRTAPMWIVVILAIAGIMSAIGFFTLETNVWALALIAALLGIIVGRKLF